MKMWWTDKRLSVLMISLTPRRGKILALILLAEFLKRKKKSLKWKMISLTKFVFIIVTIMF